MNTLYIIPARAGSKGIPGKNLKLLGGRPLIARAIDTALECATDEGDEVCVSTDSEEIARVARQCGASVPFLRPAHLATDQAGTYEVLLHALDFYEAQGRSFSRVVLLQPTSPLRTAEHVRGAMALYTPDIDMVVSVCPSAANPYYDIYEDDLSGLLHISKGPGTYTRRQDCPPAWQLNGAVYVINPQSLRRMPISRFTRRRKYVMDAASSVDLDTPLDWLVAETILAQQNPQ